ncbi:MAG: hypothetical protein JWP30_891, partial [Homoserinimonas sp.]|nr:hypothetical protein [Homoserinimonas sp.]
MRVTSPSRPEPRVATRHWVALSAAAVTVAAAPFVLPSYPLALLTLALAYGLFAFGLDLSWGRVGVVSIGHAAFFGIGAYGVAIAAHNQVPQLIGAIGALVISAVTALLIGRIGLGPKALASTMAVITLALTLLAEQGARSWLDLTNGSNGIFVPSPGVVANFYTTGVLVFVIVVAVWFLLLRGRFGRRAVAVRFNEHRTEHLGVSPIRIKVTAFVLSALIATAAGAIAAPVMGLVSPGTLGIVMSTQVLVWVAVGGKGTIFGVFLGAAVVTIGQQYLGDAIGAWYLLVLGVVFILVVKFAPSGLVGILSAVLRRNISRTASQGAIIDARSPLDRPKHTIPGGADAIRVTAMHLAFGAVPIIKGVDLAITCGEIVCLIGPNGAGKTTLLNLIAGDLSATSGRIEVLGQDVTRWAPHRRANLGLGR